MKLEFIGCTPKKINQFNQKNIYSVEDLVKYLPKEYYDFRRPKLIRELKEDETTSVVLKIIFIREYFGQVHQIQLTGVDAEGQQMKIFFFNSAYLMDTFIRNRTYIFCGKIKRDTYQRGTPLIITNPIRFSEDISGCQRIVSAYKKIPAMSEAYLEEHMTQAITVVDKEDYLEPEIQNKFHLISSQEALYNLHMPESFEQINNAKQRLLFDDLFYFNFMLQQQKEKETTTSPYSFGKYPKVRQFLAEMKFELTPDQKTTLNQIALQTRSKKRVNAVIQGDVGCGKTIVCELCMLMAHDVGYQSVVLAPTIVLAKQHFEEIQANFTPLGVQVRLLTSETKVREKRKIMKEIKEGSVHMVVGTHSLLNPEIEYHNLALTVIDEEHKFGVEQREALHAKGEEGVHCISMSATPIPRTLALSMYGDSVDVFTIKTMPKGRRPVKTSAVDDSKTAYLAIKKELDLGHQAYIVCPFIETSENEKMSEIKSVKAATQEASQYFQKYHYRVDSINAKMKQSEILEKIQAFTEKKFDVLVSTTIIEVGVNIPNATIMLIENAERFGLSQLHQLRGRVGRSVEQSYCYLHANLNTEMAQERNKSLCTTNDGFLIAKKDLELRGTGDFIGTMQTGDNKYIMLLLANEALNRNIHDEIVEIFKDDKRKELYEKKMQKKYNREYQTSAT
ncbi:MAG: ATP-dependent DNA helicase RecG [Erysipelotrichaceae bacterium]